MDKAQQFQAAIQSADPKAALAQFALDNNMGVSAQEIIAIAQLVCAVAEVVCPIIGTL